MGAKGHETACDKHPAIPLGFDCHMSGMCERNAVLCFKSGEGVIAEFFRQ